VDHKSGVRIAEPRARRPGRAINSGKHGWHQWARVACGRCTVRTPLVVEEQKHAAIGTERVVALTGQVTDCVRSATDTVTGITDAASAEAAVPKLRELSIRLDAVRVVMDQRPADARARLLALMKDLHAQLMPTLDSVVTLPAVGDQVEPWVDERRCPLDAMVTAEPSAGRHPTVARQWA
jgi:hypothetical protein